MMRWTRKVYHTDDTRIRRSFLFVPKRVDGAPSIIELLKERLIHSVEIKPIIELCALP